jgi:hypothetical protein
MANGIAKYDPAINASDPTLSHNVLGSQRKQWPWGMNLSADNNQLIASLIESPDQFHATILEHYHTAAGSPRARHPA